MRKIWKRATAALLSLGVAASVAAAPVSAENGYWNHTEEGWRYLIGDKPVAGRFAHIDGKWYNFDENGLMQTGWYNLPNSDIWYYFGSDGAAVVGDWAKVGGSWYYLDSAGYMVTGWQKVDETWYYFEDYGALKTGWVKRSGKWYYVTPGGVYKTGWQLSNGRWYYLKMDGTMATDCTLLIDGVEYSFDMNGVWWVSHTDEAEGEPEEEPQPEIPEEPQQTETEEAQQPAATKTELLSRVMAESVSAVCAKRPVPEQAVTSGYLQSTLVLDRSLVKEFSGVMNESGSVMYLVLEAQPGKMNDLLIQLNVARRTLVLSLQGAQSKVWSSGDYLALMVLDGACRDAEDELEVAAAAFDAAAQQVISETEE